MRDPVRAPSESMTCASSWSDPTGSVATDPLRPLAWKLAGSLATGPLRLLLGEAARLTGTGVQAESAVEAPPLSLLIGVSLTEFSKVVRLFSRVRLWYGCGLIDLLCEGGVSAAVRYGLTTCAPWGLC